MGALDLDSRCAGFPCGMADYGGHGIHRVTTAGFAYAHEHLKTAAYELLMRTANRAENPNSAEVCAKLATEQQAMADRVAGTFDSVVQTTLKGRAVLE
jgi:ferritin-like metal-binding protein YciE